MVTNLIHTYKNNNESSFCATRSIFSDVVLFYAIVFGGVSTRACNVKVNAIEYFHIKLNTNEEI